MGKIDKKNIEPATVNSLYPTTNNTTNRFAILATNDDYDKKTIIINNRANKQMETAYSTSIIHISKQETISDIRVTIHFVLPLILLKNVQPARKPISVNLPYRSKLSSTHTCYLDIAGIPEKANHAHIVPVLSHVSLVSIIFIFNAVCKVQYDEDICSVYYNSKLVWRGGREPQTRL